MRAVVQDRYGPPEVLRIAEVERPLPKEDEVLVRVHASTVTRGDAMGVRHVEYKLIRVLTGIRRPRRTSSGTEFAGRVEDVGPAVTEFRAGDDVFGVKVGSNADYVAVSESGPIALKPTGLTYEEAAAIPDGSLLALTCLRPAYPLPGKSVLVYGAAGSVGTAAVQLLAHHFEAEVTAVCDTKDVDLVRSLGARAVHDRLREDFTKNGKTYDVIFDAVGKHSFRRCRRSLKRGGIYISMDVGFMYHVLFLALVTRLVGSRRATLGVGRYRKEDLLLVKELVETGKYRPVIDRRYALDQVVEATRYVEAGQKTGNVVLRVSEAAPGERPEPAAKHDAGRGVRGASVSRGPSPGQAPRARALTPATAAPSASAVAEGGELLGQTAAEGRHVCKDP
jgi:NADPH:quinone reductase-like Zn-dependent oxidoreductase